MEKVLQILIVFVLLMLVVSRFFREREFKFREYIYLQRIRHPLPSDISGRLLSTVVRHALAAEPGDAAAPVPAVSDPDQGLLFRRGPDRTRALEIVDEYSGLVISTLETDEVDAILFEPATRLVYCYSVSGSITVIRGSGRDGYRVLQSLAAPEGGTMLSLDPIDKKLYVESEGSLFVFAFA
jgi:hypothetical protein